MIPLVLALGLARLAIDRARPWYTVIYLGRRGTEIWLLGRHGDAFRVAYHAPRGYLMPLDGGRLLLNPHAVRFVAERR